MEHVDFATGDDGNYDDFEELGETECQLISGVQVRDIYDDDTQSTEVSVFLMVIELGKIDLKAIYIISIENFCKMENNIFP